MGINEKPSSKYILIKVCIFLYLLFPFSCETITCNHSCCGENFKESFTEIDSLRLAVGSVKLRQDSKGVYHEFASDTSTQWDKVALNISVYNVSLIAHQNMGKFNHASFSLVNRLQACSPPEPQPAQKITSISITSDQDMTIDGALYAAGTDLVSFFGTYPRYRYEEMENIEGFITEQNDNPYRFGSTYSSVIFGLQQKVPFPQQKLSIAFHFDDNSVFTLSTDEFIVK